MWSAFFGDEGYTRYSCPFYTRVCILKLSAPTIDDLKCVNYEFISLLYKLLERGIHTLLRLFVVGPHFSASNFCAQNVFFFFSFDRK